MLIEECIVILQHKLPSKWKDLGCCTIPYNIGYLYLDKTLCDLGVSINLIPLSLLQKIGFGKSKSYYSFTELVDRSI